MRRDRWAVPTAAVLVALSLAAAVRQAPPPSRPCPGSTFTSTFGASLGVGTYNREVFLRKADGRTAPVTSGGVSYAPTISDDARLLAYTRGRTEMVADAAAPADELFVRPLTGSDRTSRLLVRASFLFGPDLSPDGRRVAVAAGMVPTPPIGPRPPLLRYPPDGVLTNDARRRVTDLPPPNRIYVLDTTTAAVVATVPAPPGAVREEQFDPVFSPDGRSVAYTSNVAVVDDADAPTISTVRVARLGDGTAGRVVTRLGRDAVWDLDWSTAGTISVTRPAGSRSYTTTLLGSDGRVLGEEPTPRGQDVIPTGPVGTTLLLPLRDLSVRRPSDVDIARCAL